MTDPITALTALNQLRLWLIDWSSSRKKKPERERQAIEALLDALTKTRNHLGDLDVRAEKDRATEKELAKAWEAAALAFNGTRHDVAPLFLLKSEAWSRPKLWSDERVRAEGITIEEISNLARRLLAKRKLKR